MRTRRAMERFGMPIARMAMAMVALSLVAGCASYGRKELAGNEYTQPESELFLMPGDELEIVFLGAPELNTTQKVRRDGRISMKLVGEVFVTGKTPGLLRKELATLYASQLLNKELVVLVRSPGPAFIGGAVVNPGRLDMERPLTVLEALMAVGGVNPDTAEVRNVVVIRHTNGKRQGYSLNLKPALNGEQGHAFYLRPFDVVYVPQTRIVKVNRWVDQYINRILPRLGLGYGSDGELTVYR